ncbi:hypothetical protein A8C56_09890 [Niabella ginsenosidivorans]|uniref:Uncharacterized protein n=1 Tax=Niabella ginsenosidivorans TaxID=1176587 RepID=A0A1A9I826_9BACT|nr:hypothetical protein [Niabella ginsenosidivorans]ANH83828.1 hypothetical protein A8C56_09890 [Niabella ginsenosidivorans]
MKKTIILIALFYVIAFLIVFAFAKLSPDGDGNDLGMGSMAVIFFMVLIALLAVINFIKGITMSKNFFIVALIHTVILVFVYYFIYQ